MPPGSLARSASHLQRVVRPVAPRGVDEPTRGVVPNLPQTPAAVAVAAATPLLARVRRDPNPDPVLGEQREQRVRAGRVVRARVHGRRERRTRRPPRSRRIESLRRSPSQTARRHLGDKPGAVRLERPVDPVPTERDVAEKVPHARLGAHERPVRGQESGGDATHLPRRQPRAAERREQTLARGTLVWTLVWTLVRARVRPTRRRSSNQRARTVPGVPQLHDVTTGPDAVAERALAAVRFRLWFALARLGRGFGESGVRVSKRARSPAPHRVLHAHAQLVQHVGRVRLVSGDAFDDGGGEGDVAIALLAPCPGRPRGDDSGFGFGFGFGFGIGFGIGFGVALDVHEPAGVPQEVPDADCLAFCVWRLGGREGHVQVIVRVLRQLRNAEIVPESRDGDRGEDFRARPDVEQRRPRVDDRAVVVRESRARRVRIRGPRDVGVEGRVRSSRGVRARAARGIEGCVAVRPDILADDARVRLLPRRAVHRDLHDADARSDDAPLAEESFHRGSEALLEPVIVEFPLQSTARRGVCLGARIVGGGRNVRRHASPAPAPRAPV